MRSFFLILLAFFLLGFPGISRAQAQDSQIRLDYDRAFQEYVFVRDGYLSALSDYRLARAQYLQAKTLVSEARAKEATVKMLEARNDVLITYLTAIKLKLLETEGVNQTVRDGLSQRLDVDIGWYQDHKSRISSAGTLKDLEADSNEARDNFNSNTVRISYEALSVMADGRVNVLRNEVNQILSELKQKSADYENDASVNMNFVSRWIAESELKITRSLDKSIEAQSLIQDFYDRGGASSLYDKIILTLEESKQLMQEASNFMKEIINEMQR